MATAPGLACWLPLPLGSLKAFVRDPLSFQLQARARFGDVFRFRIGPMIVHFLYHPDHVRHVLQDHQKLYPRGWHYRIVRQLVGNGLVVSDGEYWRRQRRLAQPAFSRPRLSRYAEVMVDAASRTLDRWEQAAAARRPVDVVAEMTRLALVIAGQTLFSRDPTGDAEAVGHAFHDLDRHLMQRFHHPLTSLPTWVPTASNRRMATAVRTLNGLMAAMIQERRREGHDRGDLLSMLMQVRDEETGDRMTDEQLCSEALTFFVAGHETTATALTWTVYLLASHPSIQSQVREEINRTLGGTRPTVDDVPHWTFTRRVLDESMRLYPPVWAVAREAAQTDIVGGYRIPARSTVVLSPFVTHRHPDFWERPEAFDPDRFLPEREELRPRYAYFPFLGGPHQCIGNEFALLEMKLIVAMIVQRFNVTLASNAGLSPTASLTLCPNGPVHIVLNQSR